MSIHCGWCGTAYEQWQNKCATCGGRMPPMPGMALGDEPPPAPRSLPRGFALRQYFHNSAANILGIILLGMGGITGLVLLLINPWFALFPSALVIGGLLLLRHGTSHASGILRAFRRGLPVEGSVIAATRDTSQSHDGQSPWKLLYQFTLEGELHQGTLIAFDDTVGKLKPHQPLWVLYLREEPETNTVYPPFK